MLYEEAIAVAEAAGMLHIAALANEAAMRRFRELGSVAAALGYATKARALYEKWGAMAKVNALEAEVPGLRDALLRRQKESTVSNPARFGVRAAQALLSTSDPNDLIATLLTLAKQTCEADVAVYASVIDGAVTLDTEAQGTSEPVQVGLAPEMVDVASPRVLRYVAAMGEELAGNLTDDKRFAGCSRLSKLRPAAICCLPVQRGQEVFGLIYLEHKSNAAAFSFSVLETLRILTANMSVALENGQITQALRLRSAALYESANKVALLEAALLQLEKFVPDIVRREIEANPQAPDIEARSRDVTVLFLDIAGYTRMNERLSPQAAHDLIEHCFSKLLDPIYRWGGEICETTGDGLIVFFSSGEPSDHAHDAVRSAREMRDEVMRFNIESGSSKPHVVVNFGLNSGSGAVGLTRLEGAKRSRWIYTVNGQVVNIAARIVAEAVDGKILIGSETERRIHNRIETRAIGSRRLKGLSMDVDLFSVD